jgi:hypothetical protein
MPAWPWAPAMLMLPRSVRTVPVPPSATPVTLPTASSVYEYEANCVRHPARAAPGRRAFVHTPLGREILAAASSVE